MNPADAGTAVNPGNWGTLEPYFATLLQEDVPPGRVSAWLARWSALQKPVLERNVALLRECARDLTDEEPQEVYRRFADGELAPMAVANAALRAKVLSLKGWQPAPEHGQFVRQWRARAALYRAENTAVSAAIGDGVRAYERTSASNSSMRVQLDGREVGGSELARLAQDADRATRETIWHAKCHPWRRGRDELDALFLDLLARRRVLARNADLPDYRTYAWRDLARLDYTPADVMRFHDAVTSEFVPLAARRHAARRAKLGVATLRPWDLRADPDRQAPLQPFDEVSTFEETMAGVFERVSPEIGALFARMRDGFLDLGWRPGKQSGGQVMVFPVSRLPHVIVGADGTGIGVDLLLHEMGHAYHYALVMRPDFLVWDWEFSDEFGEFAAIALTHLARPYLARERGGFYTWEEAKRAHRWYLDEVVVNGLATFSLADSFQHWVYADAPPDIGPADLDAKWVELTARFTPWVDWSGLEADRASGWQREWFLFGRPFYDLTYELAHLGALQVWRRAQADEAGAWRDYRAALALGNTRSLPALYAAAGARLPFESATVRDAARFVADQLAAFD